MKEKISNYAEGFRLVRKDTKDEAKYFWRSVFWNGAESVRVYNAKKSTMDGRDLWVGCVCDHAGHAFLDKESGKFTISPGFPTAKEALYWARQIALKLGISQESVLIRDTEARGPGHTNGYVDQFRYEVWKAVDDEFRPKQHHFHRFHTAVQDEVNKRMKAKKGTKCS